MLNEEVLMLNIAVCDDVAEVAGLVGDIIKEISLQWEKKWNVNIYSSGEELLKEIEKMDVVFLDIEMPGMNGIEIGRTIQNINPQCHIIMQTGETRYANDAFKINAIRYLVKPIDRSDLEEALKEVEERKPGNVCIEVFRNRVRYEIREREICFVKAMGSYCQIHSGDRVFRKDSSMNEMQKLLDGKLFFRIHREYIVNMKKISDITGKEIMVGEHKLPVSARNMKSFEKAFIEFDLKYGRSVL